MPTSVIRNCAAFHKPTALKSGLTPVTDKKDFSRDVVRLSIKKVYHKSAKMRIGKEGKDAGKRTDGRSPTAEFSDSSGILSLKTQNGVLYLFCVCLFKRKQK